MQLWGNNAVNIASLDEQFTSTPRDTLQGFSAKREFTLDITLKKGMAPMPKHSQITEMENPLIDTAVDEVKSLSYGVQ